MSILVPGARRIDASTRPQKCPTCKSDRWTTRCTVAYGPNGAVQCPDEWHEGPNKPSARLGGAVQEGTRWAQQPGGVTK